MTKEKTQNQIKTHNIVIKDESLIRYYSSELGTSNVREFMMQRIEDSPTYIVLFATGLLLMIGTNPFAV